MDRRGFFAALGGLVVGAALPRAAYEPPRLTKLPGTWAMGYDPGLGDKSVLVIYRRIQRRVFRDTANYRRIALIEEIWAPPFLENDVRLAVARLRREVTYPPSWAPQGTV